MPRQANETNVAEAPVQPVMLSDHTIQTERMPVFEGIKVVYIGRHTKRALSKRGRVNVDVAHLADGRTITTRVPGRHNGRQFYDFTLRDQHGQLNPRRMPEDYPIHEVRGAPFAVVEHPDHLYDFARARGEFRLVSEDPDAMRRLEEFIVRRERVRSGLRKDLGELTGSQEEVVTSR